MHQITPVVKRLLGLHIAIYLAQSLLDIDLVGLLGLRCILSSYFKPYQFFTHLFVHASFGHLLSNMFALFTFGPVLEYTLHAKKFITFYMITGLGAAALHVGIQYVEVKELATLYHAYLAQPAPESFVVYLNRFPHATYSTLYPFISAFFEHSNDLAYITESKKIVHQLYKIKADMPTVGASGSIFGIFTAFAMLFPNTELFLFFIPLPIKAKYVIAIYGVYELYAGIRDNPTDHVAHFAHLGGIVSAYCFIMWWKRRRYDW
jgi:membrane associated rhomboid family serine protease